MQRFLREEFILSEDLIFSASGDGYLSISGTIKCKGGIEVLVAKILKILSGSGHRSLVQTIEYSYNAYVAGQGNILRYNSPHDDHNQFHHVHRFDFFGGGDETVEEIKTEEDRPTLSDVLEELRNWYWQNVAKFPE